VKIRAIDLESEYPALISWWTKRGLPPPPKVILSGAQGFAVNAGIDVVMAWLYRSGNVAFVEWITSNPAVASSPTTVEALTALLDFSDTYCRKEGATVMLCSSQDNGGLGRFLTGIGWAKCEGRPHNFFIKSVT
jgi:hypothetical protein